MTEGFQPLSLIFDSASNQLYLMVKEGSTETQNLVSTYMIEYKQIESKKVAQNIISSFSHVKSTRSHVLFFKEKSNSRISVAAYNFKSL